MLASMKCPPISEIFVFADDAKLAAQLSCVLARPGVYLPVCDGPRLQRPDRDAEIIRRHNAAARARTNTACMAGVSDESFEAMRESLNQHRQVPCHRISSSSDLSALPIPTRRRDPEPLRWGTERIGIGMLKALRTSQDIIFDAQSSPNESVPSKRGHLVVCEEGEELAQVIAANYAFALDAGLTLIPEVNKEAADALLEFFYTMYDPGSGLSPRQAQEHLRQELLKLCGGISVPAGGSITFVGQLPFGFAYPEHPSTHLFDYPDLGICIVNGFAAEQPNEPGTGVVVLVDPGTTPAPEIRAAIDLLRPRRAFIRIYQDRAANVRHVSEMIDHFPYDFLIIATHCGDSSGYRWTYEFKDSEGRDRIVVVDIAVGFAHTDDPEVLSVTQFMRYISVDGVDWNNPQEKAKLHVGTAMWDFMNLIRSGPNELKPVKRETVPRVVGSSAMMMADGNYIVMPRSLADEGTPIIINNACLSWHQLAGTFMFANARAYVGTLFPITPSEAAAVVVRMLDKHWQKPLAAALWAAQRDVYGTNIRRPYVVTGVYPQRLRVKVMDYPARIKRQLARSLANWKRRRASLKPDDSKQIAMTEEIIKVYTRELTHFLGKSR
jgi:hypothetical protein